MKQKCDSIVLNTDIRGLLKSKVQYIVVLLLVVFGVTVVPFNALHTHAEHEHTVLLYGHQEHSEETHHCELDDLLCQESLMGECEHESHIRTTISKCFSCEFHFIKQFEVSEDDWQADIHSTGVLFDNQVRQLPSSPFIFLTNKGPPQTITV